MIRIYAMKGNPQLLFTQDLAFTAKFVPKHAYSK